MDGIKFELGKTSVGNGYEQYDGQISEVLFFLEDKIVNNDYSSDELEFYEDYKRSNYLNKDSDTFKKLFAEVQRLFNEKY